MGKCLYLRHEDSPTNVGDGQKGKGRGGKLALLCLIFSGLSVADFLNILFAKLYYIHKK